MQIQLKGKVQAIFYVMKLLTIIKYNKRFSLNISVIHGVKFNVLQFKS